MAEQPRMKKISSFQTRYLRVLRKIKGSSPDDVLEKTKSGAETLLETFPEEEGLREAISKLWIQSIGTFENIISSEPKQCANHIRKIASLASSFLIDKYGTEAGPLIKDIYKAAIMQFLLLQENMELGQRIAKRIAIDGAENVRKIDLEEIAKEILKLPFMKIKPKGSMF
jgi:hypothetical protein